MFTRYIEKYEFDHYLKSYRRDSVKYHKIKKYIEEQIEKNTIVKHEQIRGSCFRCTICGGDCKASNKKNIIHSNNCWLGNILRIIKEE